MSYFGHEIKVPRRGLREELELRIAAAATTAAVFQNQALEVFYEKTFGVRLPRLPK